MASKPNTTTSPGALAALFAAFAIAALPIATWLVMGTAQ